VETESYPYDLLPFNELHVVSITKETASLKLVMLTPHPYLNTNIDLSSGYSALLFVIILIVLVYMPHRLSPGPYNMPHPLEETTARLWRVAAKILNLQSRTANSG
jgi:hypothetical protein